MERFTNLLKWGGSIAVALGLVALIITMAIFVWPLLVFLGGILLIIVVVIGLATGVKAWMDIEHPTEPPQ